VQARSLDQTTRTLDMNTAFAHALNGLGTSGEWLLLGSVVNTFLTFYGWESMYVTVNGQVIDTGHNIYDEALTYFE